MPVTIKRPAILVVDDEPEIRVALQDLFEDDYEVWTASSGAEALDLADNAPALAAVLSDQRMPGMTGDVFLAALRSKSDAQTMLLTGYADLAAVVAAVNEGHISAYAHKPWEPATLRNMVAQAVSRWQMSRALRTEQTLLRGLLDSSAEALCFLDAERRVVRLNAAKAAGLGREIGECLGRPEAALVGEAGAAKAEALRHAAAEAQARGDGVPETIAEVAPGRVLASSWHELGHGYWMLRERDVTEQRVMEARLRQAEKMQALGTMAGGVAHDFNNLLTAILGSLELAKDRVGEDARLGRLIANAHAAAERGAGLTQRLLSFSRQGELALQDVELNRVVAGIEDLLRRSAGDVEVTLRLTPGLHSVRVDPGQLELALLNLCVNARDAVLAKLPPETRPPRSDGITILTEPAAATTGTQPELEPGRYVALVVQDTGCGMSPEVAARVFEPFFTTKESGKGTGLGLSMVYGFVSQSGGGIRIDSTPGLGTRMELFLPCS